MIELNKGQEKILKSVYSKMVDEQAQVSYLEYLKFDVDYLIDNGFITKICDASTLESFIYFVGATYNGMHYAV